VIFLLHISGGLDTHFRFYHVNTLAQLLLIIQMVHWYRCTM